MGKRYEHCMEAADSFGTRLLSLSPSVNAHVFQTLMTDLQSLETVWSWLLLHVSVLMPAAARHLKNSDREVCTHPES